VASVLTPRSRGRLKAQCLGSVSPRSWYTSASSRSRALKALVSVLPRLELSTPRSRPRSRASRPRSRFGLD